MEKDGTCGDIAIVMGAVGPTVIRAKKAEALLQNKSLNDALVEKAAAEVSSAADPFSDIRGSVEYKRHLVGVLFRRALDVALRRARGEEVETAHG